MSISEHKHMPEPVRRIEVFTGAGRRRSWSGEEKAAIIAESYGAGETVCAVARRHGLTPQQLFAWRRLAALVRETMRTDPFSGVVYVFRAKRADRVKLIFWDGTGVVLVAKRLENGQFRWPTVRDGVMRLSAAQLQGLLEGLDCLAATA